MYITFTEYNGYRKKYKNSFILGDWGDKLIEIIYR